MVLFYGLLALETANNTIASAAATTSSSTRRESLAKKTQMSSSSNSWIYTEDLRKRFEERYGDYRYIFVPIYINGKTSRHNHSTTGIIPDKFDMENSWIYSRSFRNHLFNSTSKICVTNQGFMRDELSSKKCSASKNHRNILLEEDDDETAENENHSIPLIKHNSVIPGHRTAELSNNNPPLVNTIINNDLSNVKHSTNRLTRLRSFFFKSSSSLSSSQ